MLILPLVFVTGCSEEEENPAGSSESYTIEDLAGDWSVTSETHEESMSIDYAAMYAMLDEDECAEEGGTYSEANGCTVDSDMLSQLVAMQCAYLGGTASGSTCTSTEIELHCCGEGTGVASMALTIVDHGDHGDITLVRTETDGEVDTQYGVITVDGTDITIVMAHDDHDDHDHENDHSDCEAYSESECETHVDCEWHSDEMMCEDADDHDDHGDDDHDDHGDDDHDDHGDDHDEDEGLSGTLSIDGDTATMVFPMEVDDSDYGDYYYGGYDYFSIPGMTTSATMTIVLEKQ
tara:strand:+ start:112 stop:987 length:876 start_codon:yes stop_codon:yes gene_type:complete